MYHVSGMCVRYVQYTRVHIQVKNGRCKSELEFAANVSLKAFSTLRRRLKASFLTSKCANVVKICLGCTSKIKRLIHCWDFGQRITIRATVCSWTPWWEQGSGLEDDRHKGMSLKIKISIAEYVEQRLEDDKSTLILCRTSKISPTKLDSALTALLFQSVFLHIP